MTVFDEAFVPVGETCPECQQGKHSNCDSTGWKFDTDEPGVCGCWWLNGGEQGGPCDGPDSVD
jgi:hypothetical protein